MNANDIDIRFKDHLHAVTKGRPYVFVIMAYKTRYPLFTYIKTAVEEELGYICIRADDVTKIGELLLPQIRFLIEQAEFVIAEMSENNANVFYEVGCADAIRKSVIMIIQKDSEIFKNRPTNLSGKLFHIYEDSADGLETFNRKLRLELKPYGNHRLELLREFLLGFDPTPAYIIANPKFPNPNSPKSHTQKPDVRTFSDNIGTLGLIRAFGATLGADADIHLVSANWSPNELLEKDYNFYSIGSHKVNPKTEIILNELQQGCKNKWVFDPLPEHSHTGEWQVSLHRTFGGTKQYDIKVDSNEYIIEDYGLIIRGPGCTKRIHMVIAGPHSLGTAAACYAATTPSVIERIKNKLPCGTLSDKTSKFWVLVKGIEDPDDHLLNRDENQLVIEAGLLA